MPRVLVLLIAGLVTSLVVGGGLVLGLAGGSDGDSGEGPGEGAASTPSDTPTTAPPARPTTPPEVTLSEVDTLTTAVRREAFCDAVAPGAVQAALATVPTGSTSYVDGQAAQVTGQVEDIAHEFACGWTASRVTARAWVFAPPVTRRVATDLVRTAQREEGCEAEPQAPPFGRPSVALVCRTTTGLQASFRGLFGDAWLTCTVSGRLERSEATERADRWCVAVLDALAEP